MKNVEANTRQRIFNAACRLFSQNGYEKVGIRAVAEAAEAQLGSVYYYFRNKESLYTEVFRSVYDLDNALTYDVLFQKEPHLLDTPEGKAEAIRRIVYDYFRRHVFTREEWRRELIQRELYDRSEIFCRLVEDVLKKESGKMMQFYLLLSPGSSQSEAYYWAHLPDTQGIYYFMAGGLIERDYDEKFLDELSRIIPKNTARIMISALNLPVPEELRH